MRKSDLKHIVIAIILLFVVMIQFVFIVKASTWMNSWDWYSMLCFCNPIIPDENTAREYAKIIYKVKTGIDYADDDFEVRYDDTLHAWNIYILTDSEKQGEKSLWLDYRGIFFDDMNGTVIEYYSNYDE